MGLRFLAEDGLTALTSWRRSHFILIVAAPSQSDPSGGFHTVLPRRAALPLPRKAPTYATRIILDFFEVRTREGDRVFERQCNFAMSAMTKIAATAYQKAIPV
jgi:hypothetical protein